MYKYIIIGAVLLVLMKMYTQSQELKTLKKDFGQLIQIMEQETVPEEEVQGQKAQQQVAPPYRSGPMQTQQPRNEMDPRPHPNMQSAPPPAHTGHGDPTQPDTGVQVPSAASSNGGVSMESLANPNNSMRQFFE